MMLPTGRKEPERFELDSFQAGGADYEEAWHILRDKMEVPPSFEVFEQELKKAREAEGWLSPQELANRD
jgi:hypothetical protein